MPVTKSANKALRRDHRRAKINRRQRLTYKDALKKARLESTGKNLKKAFSQLDLAGKKMIIHPNKAARLKSRLSQLAKTLKSSPRKTS